jgi:hypothetical protein
MSPEQAYEPKIPYTRVLFLLMVIIIPISIYGFYTIQRADASMQENIGNSFRTIAEANAFEVSTFIYDRVIQAGMLAASPGVRRMATQANQRYRGMSQEAFDRFVIETEKNWNQPAGAALVQQIIGNDVAENLRNVIKLDPRFLRITITDDHGSVIAASHKTLDYYQADEDFWQDIYAEGRGSISITDVLYDDLTKANYIGIGMPIIDPTTERFLGALDALIDVSELSHIVKRANLGPTFRVSLVKSDGMIISAPSITLAMRAKSEDFDAVAEILDSHTAMSRGYVVASYPGGSRHLVAVADTGLRTSYSKLDWLVLVGQDTEYAYAPIRTANTLISFMALAGLAFLTLLVVIFDMNRKRRYLNLSEATGVKPADADM